MKKMAGNKWLSVLIFVLSCSLSGNAFAQTGLAGRWHFDEGTGTTASDSSGNGNSGTLYNMSSCWVSGRSGYALSFDGTNDYVLVPDSASLSITDEISVEAWVKPDTRTDYHVIACKGSYTYFLATRNGHVFFYIGKADRSDWNAASVIGQTALDSTKWYHLVGTYKDGTGKIYVNGVLDGLCIGSNESIGSYGAGLSVGSASSYSSTYFFQGVIDEVNIYNQALTESEIQTNLLCGLWHFDEGSGATVADSSAAGNDGTLYNMSSCWVSGKIGDALEFDGSNDYALMPDSDSLDITNEVSVEAWVEPDTRPYHHIIACKGSYTYWLSTFAGKTCFLIGKANRSAWNVIAEGQTTLDSTKWYHLAGTYKNGIANVYVNGVLDGTATGTNENIGSYGAGLSIGSASSYSSTYFFDGIIDELKIQPRAMSGWECLQHCLDSDARCSIEFDEGSGTTVADSSGNNNNGTLYNMSSCWGNGRVGYALTFDGTNDYVLVPDSASLSITDEISVEAWVKPDTRTGYHVIACKGSYTYFLSTFAGKTCFLIGKANRSAWNVIAEGQTTLDSTKWYHLAGTYKNGIANVYVNGVLDGTATGTNENIGSYGAGLSIGSASSYTSNYFFQGTIDQVNLFSRAMTQPQINQRFIAHGGAYGFGCEEQPTGNPIGGGAGYSDIKTTGNYVVNTLAQLKSALSIAQSGNTIFVTGTAEIKVTGETLTIPAGVILASNRGYNSSAGAMIYADDATSCPLLLAGGINVRITGLRIRGPSSEIGTDPYSPTPTDGIQAAYSNLQVDNCEISAWAHSGIFLDNGATTANIRHNYIHHCQRVGLGYGVSHGYGNATSVIEANKFDYCRHVVAGTGTTGNSYEVRYNLALENNSTYSSVFDMHGGYERKDGTDIAGDNIYIHHNTSKAVNVLKVVGIRGIPNVEAVVYNNWFVEGYADQSNAWGNMKIYMNLLGIARSPDRITTQE